MNVSFWVGTFWTSSWPERNNMSGFGYTDTLLIRIHVFLVLVFFWDLLTIWRISPDISLREMLLRPSVDIINVEETVLTSPVSLSVHRGSSPFCAGSRERCRGWPAAAGTVWSPRWSPRCPQLHTHTHTQTYGENNHMLVSVIYFCWSSSFTNWSSGMVLSLWVQIYYRNWESEVQRDFSGHES